MCLKGQCGVEAKQLYIISLLVESLINVNFINAQDIMANKVCQIKFGRPRELE